MRRKNIKFLTCLTQSGLTSHELAIKAGVHPITVSRLLNRRQTAKEATARAIAEALQTTPEALELVEEGGAA
ncbi:MAG: helix-turn-helix domain-containing protein [Candidatus Pacebacteria bacterium]|nr:helix-turn-helix domain-containing protein [Candidatus Paceibacterota bacterium]